MKVKRPLLSVLLLLLYGYTLAQTSKDVLHEIAQLQITDDTFYDTGLFPTQRVWFGTSTVEDNNIFTTASIGYLLRSLRPRVAAQQQSVIDSILQKISPLYEKYYSRRQVPTYNFWQTTAPDLPFPNGGRLLEKESYRLPDDYDDTSIIRLSAGWTDSLKDAQVRLKMVSYAMRENRKPVKKTLKKYQNELAYEVFFVDKMDQEYDLVVMCNTLLFTFTKGFPLHTIDEKTIRFIKDAIRDRDHIAHPEEMAPSYRSSIWILYHLCRVIAADTQEHFDDIKPQIIQDLRHEVEKAESHMVRLLAGTSLIRLGQDTSLPAVTYREVANELNTFIFFYAKLSKLSWVPTMKWRSRAFNLALVYEYMVLSENLK